MDEIVRYQLRKPSGFTKPESLALTLIPVKKEVERLVEGLNKVYHDKDPVN